MTAKLHNVATLQDMLTRQVTHRNVRKLAESLGVALNISATGSQLVMALGSGHERTNYEALQTWVRQTLNEKDLLPTREALPTLIKALEAQLIQLQQGEA
ncbi:hypothetical protein [Vreelandella massiliensis]|uniref:hypothetical protein n=1 Tax=Vreelandella massiliensis TaxID=1816686 RepID=UPI00096A9C53|nr:hypothetical protein [Halomonas massiliensis]MYL24943.1 hypothetical protein [Halomonas alkaliantarctica]